MFWLSIWFELNFICAHIGAGVCLSLVVLIDYQFAQIAILNIIFCLEYNKLKILYNVVHVILTII